MANVVEHFYKVSWLKQKSILKLLKLYNELAF